MDINIETNVTFIYVDIWSSSEVMQHIYCPN